MTRDGNPIPEQLMESFSQLFADFFKLDGSLGTDLELSDEEAAAGCRRDVTITRRMGCEACAGRGSAGAGARSACARCKGRGYLQQTQGFFTLNASCEACHGRGAIVADPCTACEGAGAIATSATLEVVVPPGAAHGQRLRLVGAGGPRPDGTAADVYVFLLVGGRADPRIAEAEAMLGPPELPRATVHRASSPVRFAVAAIVLVLVLAGAALLTR